MRRPRRRLGLWIWLLVGALLIGEAGCVRGGDLPKADVLKGSAAVDGAKFMLIGIRKRTFSSDEDIAAIATTDGERYSMEVPQSGDGPGQVRLDGSGRFMLSAGDPTAGSTGVSIHDLLAGSRDELDPKPIDEECLSVSQYSASVDGYFWLQSQCGKYRVWSFDGSGFEAGRVYSLLNQAHAVGVSRDGSVLTVAPDGRLALQLGGQVGVRQARLRMPAQSASTVLPAAEIPDSKTMAVITETGIELLDERNFATTSVSACQGRLAGMALDISGPIHGGLLVSQYHAQSHTGDGMAEISKWKLTNSPPTCESVGVLSSEWAYSLQVSTSSPNRNLLGEIRSLG